MSTDVIVNLNRPRAVCWSKAEFKNGRFKSLFDASTSPLRFADPKPGDIIFPEFSEKDWESALHKLGLKAVTPPPTEYGAWPNAYVIEKI